MATSKSPEQPTPEQEAANENTSQERLRELAGVSTELARIVANNPNANHNLLRKLGASLDETTRKAVAANPNTPTELLWKLAEEFPEQLWDNPVFLLWPLENPNLLADMPVATLASLLKIDAVPKSWLLWAASHTDERVLLAVAMNPNTPKSALEKLIQSRCFDAKQEAKLHVNWAGEMSEGWNEVALAKMVAHGGSGRNVKDEEQLWEVGAISDVFSPALYYNLVCRIAENTETLEHILKILGACDPGATYLALARNPQTPVSVLEPVVGEGGGNLIAAANPNTPFASVQQFQLQLGRVLHPHTDSDSLRELAISQWEYIRLGVAAHLNTPQDVLEQLALDPEYVVRMAVALNKNTPTRALQQLARHGDIQMLLAIAHHPHASADALEQVAALPEGDISLYYSEPYRTALYFNPNLPTSLLKKLVEASRGEFSERLYLRDYVKNPRIDSDTLRELIISGSASIRFLVAIHPKTPQDVLEQLALDPDDFVRMAVALNKNTPARALQQLARHKNIELLHAIACHPHTSADVLKQLAAVPKDNFFQICEVVALNPNTPTSLVEELALDPAVYSFSMSLAQNPNTPVSILQQLTKYPDVQVQRCAQSTLQLGSKLKNHSADCTEATPALYTSWVASKSFNSLEIAEGIDDFCVSPLEIPQYPSPHLLGARIAGILNRGNRRLIAMNPATSLDTLRHIALNDEKQGIQDEAITTLAQNAFTPGEILQQLVEKADGNEKGYWFYWSGVALATHPNIPVAALEELANTRTNWAVRSVVAKNPNTPATALEQLARDDNWQLRKVVAQNSHTPPSALEKLLQDKVKYVRAAALANPNTPKNFQQQIEQLNNPEISQARLAELATSQWLIIRQQVALHPNTSVSLLEELAKDEKSAVRGAVAHNPHTPENILERLLTEDKDKEMAIAVAANPNTPIKMLEQIAQKKTRNQRLQRAAMKNIFSRCPDKLTAFLEKLLKSKQPSFTRVLVFLNPLAPSEFLAKNFRSSFWLERYAIATNPNTPLDPLKFLAQDGNRIVRAAAKANLQQSNALNVGILFCSLPY